MTSLYLSKSNFKVARTCPTKLYYLQKGYPSAQAGNEYLEFLADGGFAIGKMAQLMFPCGVLIDPKIGLKETIEETKKELEKETCVLFEAALQSSQKLALVDVLEKKGNSINLIEVKSKSFDSDKNARLLTEKGLSVFNGRTASSINADWREYIEDIAFQTLICRELYPDFEVTPYLFLPDKAQTTSIEGLASWFRLFDASAPGSKYREIGVEFLGNQEQLQDDCFLQRIDVSKEVSLVIEEVSEAATRFTQSYEGGLKKIPPSLGKKCKNCEFKIDGETNGYRECWGENAEVSPHIFDLYFGGAIKQGQRFLIDVLSSEGKCSLFDIPSSALSGVRGERQGIQIHHTKNNTEWFNPSFEEDLKAVVYPLHFIDFETSRVAIPYHANMRPYELVAFQWSCHSIKEPGAEPEHSEWINTEDTFPNFDFARSLIKQVGQEGSLLAWSHHENTTLNDILNQVHLYGLNDPQLIEWLSETVNSEEHSNRIVDLEKFTKNNYFHPEMKGSTSLKYVLPAVWCSNKSLHTIPWLTKYVKEIDGKVLNPYEVLPQIEIAAQAEVVAEGTGAMRAYQDMLYGLTSQNPIAKEKWRKLLLQYCELDTMAMVIVWAHWRKHFGLDA